MWQLVVAEAVPDGLPGKTVDEIWRSIRSRPDLERFPQRPDVDLALRELQRRGTIARVWRNVPGSPPYCVYWRPVRILGVA